MSGDTAVVGVQFREGLQSTSKSQPRFTRPFPRTLLPERRNAFLHAFLSCSAYLRVLETTARSRERCQDPCCT